MPLTTMTATHTYKDFLFSLIVRWPDQGTPQNFGETILMYFLIDMMILIKNQEGVEV